MRIGSGLKKKKRKKIKEALNHYHSTWAVDGMSLIAESVAKHIFSS